VPLRRIRRRTDLPDDEPVELAALADESLDPERRAALEARMASSPELAARLEEQERALLLVRGVSGAVEAPAGLRARIEAERRPRSRLPRQRFAIAGGLAAVAATALALALVLPGGAGGPSIAAAAELSTHGATAPAPAAQPGRPKLLARDVGGVPFPYWQDKFGWRATGARTDTLDGRSTATIFYVKQHHRLGYTIVDGPALKVPRGATVTEREGTELRTFRSGGRLVVTWLRGGRTCVLVGRGVELGVLLKLAAWKGKGAVPF
jgi:anti-sigma factor RsiW